MRVKIAIYGFLYGALLVGCTGQGLEGQPFTTANQRLQTLWDGPKSWAEDWCDQTDEFRDAYSALVQYRMRPYTFTITCPGKE